MQQKANYVRNFIFGVEDSLVSTVGLVTGIAAAGVVKETVLLTGTILIFVEAFSMAVGSLLSENGAKQFELQTEIPLLYSFKDSIVMFFSYFFSGFIVLVPYVFLPSLESISVSITVALASLFVLGVINAKISRIPIFRTALKMVCVGGTAVFIGVMIGKLFVL